jgi:hypothetical protein
MTEADAAWHAAPTLVPLCRRHVNLTGNALIRPIVMPAHEQTEPDLGYWARAQIGPDKGE